jgi:hypothetical protein
MRKPQHLVALALLLGACAPQSAELVSGEFVAFVAESNSQTLSQERIDLEAFDDYVQVDCRYFGADEAIGEALRLEDRVPMCGAGDDGSESVFLVDSDGAADDEFGSLLPDVYDTDDDNDGVPDDLDCDDADPGVGECDGDGDGFWPPASELWMKYDGWHIVSEDLDPWRGEGIVTHEGDLQVTFHHKLPGGADFSFQFAIDRFFQPVECAFDAEKNEVVRAAYDGDWIDGWSTDLERIASLRDDEVAFAPFAHLDDYLDGGRLFYLNARGYQVNPDENDDRWFIPEQWAAGAAQGKFGEELVADRGQLYNEPYLTDLFAGQGVDEGAFGGIGGVFSQYLWYCDLQPGEDVSTNACMQALTENVDEDVLRSASNLDLVFAGGDPEAEPMFNFSPIRHDNAWRVVDGTPDGFDGWAESYSSYVVFSEDSDLRIGGFAKGAFTLFLVGQDSNTTTIIKGEFNIPKLKADNWVPDDLREQKREESGLEFCAF